MNRLIVMIGAHSSGKTTLGQMLADRLGWRFDDEIGYRMRLDMLESDPNQFADVEQHDFDRLVSQKECSRDKLRKYDAVIETWHGGNLAYVRNRSQDIYAELKHKIEFHLSQLDVEVTVVPLNITLPTLIERQHEDVSDVRFFHQVGSMATNESRMLNLYVVEPVCTDAGRTTEECVEEILEKISRGF